MTQNYSPRETVSELDRHIIGQKEAKRAVAIAMRNRWRRQQLDDTMRNEGTGCCPVRRSGRNAAEET